jgi:hypothetical protein
MEELPLRETFPKQGTEELPLRETFHKERTHGAGNVNYSYATGWSKSAKRLRLMNATQWARMEKDFFLNKGRYTDEEIEQGEGYDWQGAVLQTSVHDNKFKIFKRLRQYAVRLSGTKVDGYFGFDYHCTCLPDRNSDNSGYIARLPQMRFVSD